MGLIESLIIFGAISGAVYALLALGFTLIYGVAEVVNMGHGASFMLGAYMFFFFASGSVGDFQLQLPLPVALILAAIFVGIVGSIIYRIFIHSIIEDIIAVLVVTIGVGLMLQQIVTIEFGVRHVTVPSLASGTFEFLGVTVTYSKLVAFVVSLCFFAGLWIFIVKSKIGGAMRAVAQDREVAMLMGINTTRLYMLTMAISSSFAAIAGILIAGSTTQMADPFMWLHPLTLSFAIVILGGLGSIKGTLIGGLIIGFAETAVITLVPEGAYLKGAVALAVMITVLLLRPKGLFGKRIELE